MSIDADLVALFCCPDTKQPVRLADAILIQKVNASVVRGELKTKGNKLVTEQMESGLVRNDMKVLYPIRENIPAMLIEEGIPLDQIS